MSRKARRRAGNNRAGKAGQQDRSRKSGGGQRTPQRSPQGRAGFWGTPTALPPVRSDVRITDDPSAVARSLGRPPLSGHEKIAEHYFSAVYDRAVTLAGALAAAGGLLTQEELEDELED